MEPTTVTISVEEYKYISDNSLMYDAMVDAGVDNWEGIDAAYRIYTRWKEEMKQDEE